MFPGYAGRTELPDNLKSMFRPISMVVPDSTQIAEILLFAEGFYNCKVLTHIIHDIQEHTKKDIKCPVMCAWSEVERDI